MGEVQPLSGLDIPKGSYTLLFSKSNEGKGACLESLLCLPS